MIKDKHSEHNKFNISYYGADYPVDSLVERMRDEEILVPHFQREYVWQQDEASRFIESLILRLPVPSIFLLRDKTSNRLIIIDGQQRLKTLLYFFQEEFPDGKKFKLKNVHPDYEHRTFRELSIPDQRELKNSIIHCIVVMDEEDSDAPFYLFERLNTTGTPLTSQEIRSALYFGPFNDLLKELSANEFWNTIVKKDNRLTDQEYILRLIAFYYDLEQYTGNMKGFLNNFMMNHRYLKDISSENIIEVFVNTIKFLSEVFKDKKRPFSIAFFEPIYRVFAKNHAKSSDIKHIQQAIHELHEDPTYNKMIRSSTASKSSVFGRFEYVASKMG